MAIGAILKVSLPIGAADLVVPYTTSSTTEAALPTGALKLWMVNVGTAACHIIVGTTGVAAAVVATCMPLQANENCIFDVPQSVGLPLYIRVIGASASGNLYVESV